MATVEEKTSVKLERTTEGAARPAGNTGTAGANRSREAVQEIDLVALSYRFLEKIHWILLAAVVGALIAGVIVYFVMTPQYQATSKIYIVGSDTTISLSDLQIGSNLAADYQEVFKNWHVHELVDKRLGLNYSYRERGPSGCGGRQGDGGYLCPGGQGGYRQQDGHAGAECF